MKIIKLQSENIKRIKALEITPDGAIVRITGRNASGKTSVLDSILYALGGDRAIPSAPIRKGFSKAHVSLDLGDLRVERNITRKGSYLKVTGKDGKAVGSPQAMLDKLVGSLSFDPLAFSREPPKRQAEILRQLAGLDLSDLDIEESRMMERRREAAAAGKALAARLEAMRAPSDDLPAKPIDTVAMQADISRAIEQNEVIHGADRTLTAVINDIETATREVSQVEVTLQNARKRVARFEAEKVEAEKELKDAGATVDVTAAMAAIQDANATNAAIAEAKAHSSLSLEVNAARADLRKRTSAIEALRESRMRRIAEAKYPLDGLIIAEDGEVQYSGLPIVQASLAEQLTISTAVAMALNPELRVLRITDGSLLDSESMAVIESLAADNDYQVWVEQVDETGEVGFYIEDGSLASVDGEAVGE